MPPRTIDTFLFYLSAEELSWLNNPNNSEAKNAINAYVASTGFNDQSIDFGKQFIQANLDTGLKLDFEKSLKSPANIDDSGIDKTTAQGKKFDCIYSKLMESSKFKNLFLNTFGSNVRLNVKFEIADNLPSNLSGTCHLMPSSGGSHFNVIRISKNLLSENDQGDGFSSNILIAKTILHECIHAYLNIKKINCNLGTTIPELEGLDLQGLIGTFYQSFGCHIDVNGSPQSQHDFIFNFMVPTFTGILGEIKNSLISAQHQVQCEGTFYNPSTNEPQIFNWPDFFKYTSMSGLHQCDSFNTAINQVPNEFGKFRYYSSLANMLTKKCN